jgi:hypothetical protein
MLEKEWPPGTRVQVVQSFVHGRGTVEARVEGVVESWSDEPTGSWFAHGKDDRLWLKRLRLRKDDGEISLLVVDDRSQIELVEAAAS